MPYKELIDKSRIPEHVAIIMDGMTSHRSSASGCAICNSFFEASMLRRKVRQSD